MTAQTYFCPKIVFLRFSEPHLVLIWAFINLKTDVSPWFVDRMKYSTLVPFFDNRWRWCRGRFSLKQIRLELDYQGSYFGQKFCHSLGFDFFFITMSIKTKHLLHFHRNTKLLSRQLCRRYTVKWEFAQRPQRSIQILICTAYYICLGQIKS